MDSLSDYLIELLNKKQETAFEVMFNLYYPRLVYFAQEYVSYDDAKGLVQDAFIAFWEKNPTIISECQLQSYLYTSVKNNCLMRLRHEKVKERYVHERELSFRRQMHISALQQLDTSGSTFQEIEALIKETLADLPPRCREVFVLSRFEGKKNQEVAKQLNISVKAVEAQITKAIKIFKVALKDYLPIVAYLILLNV